MVQISDFVTVDSVVMDFGFWDLELRADEKEEECPACNGIGYGLEGEGQEAMTQGFIHGVRMRQESSGVKGNFEKFFRDGEMADFAGVFRAVQVLTGRGKGQGEAGEKATLNDSRRQPRVREMRIGKQAWEKAKAKYFAGETWETIANDLQLNKATLTNKASLEGITKVKREAVQISPKKEISLESLSALVRSKLAQDAASTLERIETYDLEGLKDEGLRETILASVAKRSALTFGWSETGESPQVSVNILGALPDRSEVRVEPSDK